MFWNVADVRGSEQCVCLCADKCQNAKCQRNIRGNIMVNIKGNILRNIRENIMGNIRENIKENIRENIISLGRKNIFSKTLWLLPYIVSANKN